jgi:hypothetical protein
MGIFVKPFMDWDHILQITKNRYGSLLLCRAGARSRFFIIFTDQLFTYLCRCDANPDNLDAGGARMRSQLKTEFLVNNWDPDILWSDFGVRVDMVVSRLQQCPFSFLKMPQ